MHILVLILCTLIHLWSGLSFAKVPNNRLVFAFEDAPRTYDPRYAVDANSQYVEGLVHCSLVDFDKKGKVVPYLAESWQWLDSKTLKIRLKAGAYFSNGQPVNPDDVKASYEFFFAQTKHLSPRAGAFKGIKEIKVAGKELIFTLSDPDASFLGNLSVGILPKELALGGHISTPEKIPSCGAFTLKKKGLTGVLLGVNSYYQLGPKPKLEEIEIKIVKDETTRYAKLQKGELDLVQNGLGIDKILGIIKSKSSNLKFDRLAGLKTRYLGYNIKDQYLKNQKVRKAISLAINRDAIIQYLLGGMASKAATMLPPYHEYFNQSLEQAEYDPKKANKILDESGFKIKEDGFRFMLSYKTTNRTSSLGIAKAIASDLKNIGIKVEVETLEWGRFKADVDKGHVQMWGLAWIGFKDPDIYHYAFSSHSFPPDGGNRGWFHDPEVDMLLDKAQETIDFTKRKKIYDKVQVQLFEKSPYAFLFHEDHVVLMQPNVKGFELYADGRYSSLRHAYKEN
ncbi:MAG: ABC transporter substrate-binding protein [Oligoflexales bacterium]